MTARTLTLSRICEAAPEVVFRTWTDPRAMKRFWTADSSWTIGDVQIDPRQGGSYRVEFGPAGSTPFVDQGEFLEFNPPHSLVYSETVTDEEKIMHGPTSCSVVFRDVGEGRTEVSVTWTLEPREATDGRMKGWTAQLDLFAALFNRR